MSNIDQAVKNQISDIAFEISQDQGQVDDLKKSTKLFTDNINRNSLKLAAVMIAATANMKGQQGKAIWKHLEEETSEGTKKKVQSFRGRFLKTNPDLDYSGDHDDLVKKLIAHFKAEKIKTKRDMEDYGKPAYELNPVVEKLLQAAVVAAGGKNGFLMEDELPDFEAAIRKAYVKFDKKNA